MINFTFGKFKHTPIKDVFQQNYFYIDWITKQNWFRTNFKEQYKECMRLLDEKMIFKLHHLMMMMQLFIPMVLVEKMDHLMLVQV